MKRSDIVLLLILAFVQFTGIVDFMILMPLKPKLTELWGINPQQFGIAVFAYGFGAFLSSLICVNKVDKYDRKKVLIFIYAGFTIGTFCCGLATSYIMLVIARFATGLFGGVSGSIIQSIVGDAIPAKNRGQAMGILMMGFALASVLGVPGGLYFAANYSWHTPFLILGCLCVAVFIGALFVVPSFVGHLATYVPQTFKQVLRSVLNNKNRRMAMLLTATIMPAHFFIIPFLTDYFTFNLGFDYGSTVPYVYVIGGLLTAIASPLIGKLSDKIGRFKVLAVLSILAVIPLIGIPNLQTHSKLVLFCFTAMFFVFSGSRMVIAMAHTTSTAEPHIRGAFLILNSSVQQFAVSIASLISGFIVIQTPDKTLHNYPILGYLSILFSIIALFVFTKVKVVKH